MTRHQPVWTVLLIGGPSGAGKTTIGRAISRRVGVDFLMVDDLRLAFQQSQVAFPNREETAALYMFRGEDAHVWERQPEELCAGLITIGRAMSPAIEVVVENHVDQTSPIVIEGDTIMPTLFARPSVRARSSGERVAGLFLIESNEDAFLANFLARAGWASLDQAPEWMPTQVRTMWLYGQWLAAEAHHYGLPVVEPRPWNTLAERILAAARSTGSQLHR